MSSIFSCLLWQFTDSSGLIFSYVTEHVAIYNVRFFVSNDVRIKASMWSMRYSSQQILSPVSLNVNGKTLDRLEILTLAKSILWLCNVKMDITYSKSNMARIDKAVEYCAIQQW